MTLFSRSLYFTARVFRIRLSPLFPSKVVVVLIQLYEKVEKILIKIAQNQKQKIGGKNRDNDILPPGEGIEC